MVYLILLLWILPSIHAGGQEDHFQTVHDAINEMIHDQVDQILQWEEEEYNTELLKAKSNPYTTVVLQRTKSNIYILDTSGILILQVRNHLVGKELSDFIDNSLLNDSGINTTKASDVLYIMGEHQDRLFLVRCYVYNLTLADNENGTMIEGVSINSCGGPTLKLFHISGNSSLFSHVKQISLRVVPFYELFVEDFVDFPELQMLILQSVPTAHMENGLLCYNLNITILEYVNSFGLLTVFPRQIFNCTIPLKLEYLHLEDHNIASLPAHAFGSAAEHLRVLHLSNIGLEVIHEDAFAGVMNLQVVTVKDNILLQIPGAMILPSTHLRVMEYNDNKLNSTLNLTALHIARKDQLKMFVWIVPRISDIVGSFCSNQSNSNLEVICLQGGMTSDRSVSEIDQTQLTGNTSMAETLPADVFAHCISLKYLSIEHTGLAYLPDRLFATHVSKLETLLLTGNKLNSNTYWSDLLMRLYELKYLDLSMNMLTSWTHNLSSLWSLEMLDLSDNAITKISHMAFINMTRLKFFSLKGNNLIALAPKVQHAFAHISLLNLAGNNIYRLNMSTEIMSSDTVIVDLSVNNLTQLDMPRQRKCSLPCGKISLFLDNNKLSRFVLPCSNTHQYSTVSLTNNKLTDIQSLFPNNVVQQCSIDTLNVSGNLFKSWIQTTQRAQYQSIANGFSL